MIPLFHDIAEKRRDFLRLLTGALAILLLYLSASLGLSAWFNRCLRRYYCLAPVKVLCIGHSMSEMGIDKTLLEQTLRVPVGKYCINGAGPVERLVMLEHYLEAVGTPPEYLVYDVSGRIFSSGLAVGSYQLFLPFLKESQVCGKFVKAHLSPREFLFYQCNPLSRYEDTRWGAIYRGLKRDWRTHKGGALDAGGFAARLKNGKFWRISMQEADLNAFEKTLELCRKKKIRVILLALPCADILNRAEPEKYQEVMDHLKSKCDGRQVQLLDYNPHYSHRYDLLLDPIHLNARGQRAVTGQLCKDLSGIFADNTENKR